MVLHCEGSPPPKVASLGFRVVLSKGVHYLVLDHGLVKVVEGACLHLEAAPPSREIAVIAQQMIFSQGGVPNVGKVGMGGPYKR